VPRTTPRLPVALSRRAPKGPDCDQAVVGGVGRLNIADRAFMVGVGAIKDLGHRLAETRGPPTPSAEGGGRPSLGFLSAGTRRSQDGSTHNEPTEAYEMRSIKIRTAIAVLATTCGLGALAGPAFAEDNIPPLVPGKCAVVDEHGNVSYVAKGTHVGLLYCGADGDWHIGWLVDAAAKPPTKKGGLSTTPPRIQTIKALRHAG
jgi:hypothetical protein